MKNRIDTQRIYFKNFDILRFLAAYMIVLLHCYFGWKVKFGNPAFLSSLSQQETDKLELVIHNLSFGVDIFFMISGFLLTYLLLREKEKTGKVDVIKFYIRRAFRIWPLYFFMILTAPLFTYFLTEPSPAYPYHFFFAGNFDILQNGTTSIATNHLWSICIEEHFYLICPLIIGLIPLKCLPETLLSIIFFTIIFRGFFLDYSSDHGMAYYVHTLSRIDVLALGGLFGYLFYHKKIHFSHSLPIRLMVYAVFILVFFNIGFNDSGNFIHDTLKKYLFTLPVAYWIGNFLFNKNAVFSAKKTNVLNQFGKFSYGIYMFNPVIIFLVICFFAKFGFQNYFMFLVSVHVALALITFLSYRFLEMPFLALKEKYAVVKSGTPVENASEVTENEPIPEVTEGEPLPEITEGEEIAMNVIKNKAP